MNWLLGIAIGVNIMAAAYNIMLGRRWLRLNRILFETCMLAWDMRSWPRLMPLHAAQIKRELAERGL